MANEQRINELLRWFPEEPGDPVPPWLINLLDRVVLRDLALISLERTKTIHEANIRAIDAAAAVLKKQKF